MSKNFRKYFRTYFCCCCRQQVVINEKENEPASVAPPETDSVVSEKNEGVQKAH